MILTRRSVLELALAAGNRRPATGAAGPKILFVDDAYIESRQDLKRVVHRRRLGDS